MERSVEVLFLFKEKKYSERQTREIWRRADAVAFDVDATVIKDTGINELAVLKGVGEQVRPVQTLPNPYFSLHTLVLLRCPL
jgi:hypothetical protein